MRSKRHIVPQALKPLHTLPMYSQLQQKRKEQADASASECNALCVVREQHTTAAHVMSSLVVQSLAYVVQVLGVTAWCNTLVRA